MHSGIVKTQKYEWRHTRKARELRRKMTPEEKIIWRHLKNRSFDGFKFRRQQVIDGFFADFYCEAARLCVEIDGGYHSEPGQKVLDEHRQKVFALRTIKTIRVKNEEIITNINYVMDSIRKALGNSPAK